MKELFGMLLCILLGHLPAVNIPDAERPNIMLTVCPRCGEVHAATWHAPEQDDDEDELNRKAYEV